MIDLHVHTNASDGEHSPRELIEIASKSCIETISITDHDNCKGVEEAVSAGKRFGIGVIPGIEITAFEGEEIHLLGYYIDDKSLKFNEYEERLRCNLREEEKIIFQVFHKLGFSVTRDEIIEKYAKDRKIEPGNFVDWLIDNGFEKNKNEAFKKYFIDGELYYRKSKRMKLTEAIKFIHSVGGIPVLAHPSRYSWSIKELLNRVLELKEYGLMGIEAVYSLTAYEKIDEYINFAGNNGLLITLGSDYHGHAVKDYIDLGFGKENSLVRYQREEIVQKILGDLKERRGNFGL